MIVTCPAPRSEWREVHALDGEALVAQSPEWVDAVCADGGYEDASRLYETTRGTRLVLPLVRKRGRWTKALAAGYSMPHAWGMGGVLADRPVESEDVTEVIADLAAGPALRTAIRPNPLHGRLWADAATAPGVATVERRAHVIDLDGGPDVVFKRFARSARAGVRKAERAGIEVECDSTGRLVPVFYALLERSVRRWADQQHEPLALAQWRARRRDPLEKFVRIASALGDTLKVWVAWKDGVPAAAMLVLLGANASDTRGAMNKEIAGPTNANDLLQWRAIEDACEAGCRSYHLGESGTSRSLAPFKEKFGARPGPYSQYPIERLPLTRAEGLSRDLVKRTLRFRDA